MKDHKRMPLLKLSCLVYIFLNILTLGIQGNPAFPNEQLHRQKNSTLPKPMLSVESGNKVPEYEVVKLLILPKTSEDDDNVIRVHLSAFGKDIRLRLQRNDDFNDRSKNVKFCEAMLTDSGVQITELTIKDDNPGTPYIDPVQMAAVAIHYGPGGELQMDGVIGDDLFIKPAPKDINLSANFVFEGDFFDESRNGLNSSENGESKFFRYSSTSSGSDLHIIYKNSLKSDTSFKVTLDEVLYKYIDDAPRHNQPLHAWPEVLLMMDYDTYAMHVFHGYNDAQIRRYCISFLNAVDLRFKVLSDPKISLILSQIIIFKSRDSTPFLKNSIYSNGTLLEGFGASRGLASYVYSIKTKQQNILPDFDVAVLLTKLDLCAGMLFFCDSGALGVATFKGACNIYHRNKRFMGIAIVEDHGGFDGILTAAHEIGHLLGASHDGQLHYSGGAGYIPFCNDDDGYIMSSKLTSDRIFEWSECSIKQIKRFLSSASASCLFNKPSYVNELEKSELPGTVLSLDEQCRRIRGTRAAAIDSRVCISLICDEPTINNKSQRVELPPAAEGSSCGRNLHCRNGKCVSKYLTYNQARTTTPVYNNFESSSVSSTKKSLTVDEACRVDKDWLFCKVFFFIYRKEACKNSSILERCCYSHKMLCHMQTT